MRLGNRWNGEATNPITAAVYCALVALVVAFALSYLFGRLGLGVVSARYAWDSPNALYLAGLNLYASQHVPLVGYGLLPGEIAPLRASVTFPLTLWVVVPFLALVLGGYLAARSRMDSGRWGMIVPAILGGILYAAVFTLLASIISAKFVSSCLPGFSGTEFNPPNIAFRPSLAAVPLHIGIFAVLSTYLGAILALRFSPEPSIAGKWWACMKAVFVTGLIIQLLVAVAGLVLFARSEGVEEETQAKFVQILPTVAGVGYALLHGAILSYEATPTAMPSAGYAGKIELYRGTESTRGGETSRRQHGAYVWIAAALAGFMAFTAGRLAVKCGSRDGSLPTAVRIVILQAAYMALIIWLSGLGWGLVGQVRVLVELGYDVAMLIAAFSVLVFALLGAHWANRRYVGRLVGYPSA